MFVYDAKITMWLARAVFTVYFLAFPTDIRDLEVDL